jgi:hypothetical protein
MLAAREVRVDGHFKRSFELVDLTSMETEKRAADPRALSVFYRWQDAGWKKGTLSLR